MYHTVTLLMEIINISSLDFYFRQSTRLFISSRTRVKKLGAAPWGLQTFTHHLNLLDKLKRGSRMFNFGEELYIWTHSIYFQVKVLILRKSDGKYSQFDEIWQTRHFWEQTGPAKKKGSKITRTCKLHQPPLISGTVSCGHHRTNQGLPLHVVFLQCRF